MKEPQMFIENRTKETEEKDKKNDNLEESEISLISAKMTNFSG